MKVVAITGKRQAAFVDKPEPTPHGDLVVVKVHVAPLCTEFKGYAGGACSDCLGHEAAGEVTAVAASGRVEVGDRVIVMPLYACGQCPLCLTGDYIHCENNIDVQAVTGSDVGTATIAQFLVKPDWMLLPIPDEMSYERAAMACCGLGPTFGAMQRMQVDAFDTVLVTGMGPVGLGGVVNGVHRKARIIAVESHPYRAELAKRLGAVAVIDPTVADLLGEINHLTDGRGVDKAIDCTGVSAAQRLLIDALRRKGQLAFVGEGAELTLHVSDDMLRKGLTLHGSWHWNLADASRLMQVIRQNGRLLDMLITHAFPMRDVQKAWELQLTGNCGKIVLHPWK